MSDTVRLQKMAARFAPTDISADLSTLSAGDKQVLAKLVEASKIMDALFLRQVWAGNDTVLIDLSQSQTVEGRARLHYFLINKGPWSRLDHDEPFVPGAPAKPAGANFYPEGASKADLERWMQSLPTEERTRATGFFTLVRRLGGASGTFTLVPYNLEYQPELTRAAALLREAAAITKEPTLKAFLTKRADAFLSNDYYESDVAWMELKGAIEPTIGPYEVYEDELFNYKAAFEAFITVQDEAESAKLQKFGGQLQDIEDHLPIDSKHRNPKLGGLAPIVVVNEMFCRRRCQSRRADGGVQPAERRTRGSRKGIQARHAEERPGREVREDARAHLAHRAVASRSEERFVRRLLYAHRRSRTDARPGAAQHHGRRTADDGPAGDEGGVQFSRGSQGRHLRTLRDPIHDRQGGAAEVARADALHDVPRVDVPIDPLWRSTRRMAAASPSS